MNLSDIYSNNVKGSVNSSGFMLPTIEKDPTILDLERKMFNTFEKIDPYKETIKLNKLNNVSTVSLEDAIKELAKTLRNKDTK
jgi:hypothetical protein